MRKKKVIENHVSQESAFYALWGAFFAIALVFGAEFLSPGLPSAMAQSVSRSVSMILPEQVTAAVLGGSGGGSGSSYNSSAGGYGYSRPTSASNNSRPSGTTGGGSGSSYNSSPSGYGYSRPTPTGGSLSNYGNSNNTTNRNINYNASTYGNTGNRLTNSTGNAFGTNTYNTNANFGNVQNTRPNATTLNVPSYMGSYGQNNAYNYNTAVNFSTPSRNLNGQPGSLNVPTNYTGSYGNASGGLQGYGAGYGNPVSTNFMGGNYVNLGNVGNRVTGAFGLTNPGMMSTNVPAYNLVAQPAFDGTGTYAAIPRSRPDPSTVTTVNYDYGRDRSAPVLVADNRIDSVMDIVFSSSLVTRGDPADYVSTNVANNAGPAPVVTSAVSLIGTLLAAEATITRGWRTPGSAPTQTPSTAGYYANIPYSQIPPSNTAPPRSTAGYYANIPYSQTPPTTVVVGRPTVPSTSGYYANIPYTPRNPTQGIPVATRGNAVTAYAPVENPGLNLNSLTAIEYVMQGASLREISVLLSNVRSVPIVRGTPTTPPPSSNTANYYVNPVYSMVPPSSNTTVPSVGAGLSSGTVNPYSSGLIFASAGLSGAPANSGAYLTNFSTQPTSIVPTNAGFNTRNGIYNINAAAPLASINSTLRRGSSGAEVTTLQNYLSREGFYTGPIDGRFGPLTAAAVEAYQARAGLEQIDGVVGPRTRESLHAVAAASLNIAQQNNVPAIFSQELLSPEAARMFNTARLAMDPLVPVDTLLRRVTPQSPASQIRELQRALQQAGFNPQGIDGAWGPATQSAVEAFQGQWARHNSAVTAVIREMQLNLNMPQSQITGRFDEDTRRALASSGQNLDDVIARGLAVPATRERVSAVGNGFQNARGAITGSASLNYNSSVNAAAVVAALAQGTSDVNSSSATLSLATIERWRVSALASADRLSQSAEDRATTRNTINQIFNQLATLYAAGELTNTSDILWALDYAEAEVTLGIAATSIAANMQSNAVVEYNIDVAGALARAAASEYLGDVVDLTTVAGNQAVTTQGSQSSAPTVANTTQGNLKIGFLVEGSSFTVPADWNPNANVIEVIGGGAGGSASRYGGGGGGGAYSRITNLALTPGAAITYSVGKEGVAGGNGGDTYFNGILCATASVCARGGNTGSGGNGGKGGDASVSIGAIKYSGGKGSNATGEPAIGAGGGAAGPNGAGVSPVGKAGGAGDAGKGGAGGGNATAGKNGTEWGNAGSGGGGGSGGSGGYGGFFGGGGGGRAFATGSAGNGAQGIIVILYISTGVQTPASLSQPVPTQAPSTAVPPPQNPIIPTTPDERPGANVTPGGATLRQSQTGTDGDVSPGTSNFSNQLGAPALSLSASPASVQSGGFSVLAWSSNNATSCTASGAWSGSKSTSGLQTLNNVTTTGNYTLTCRGGGVSTSRTVTITVTSGSFGTPTPTPDSTLYSLSATPNPCTLATGATSCTTYISWQNKGGVAPTTQLWVRKGAGAPLQLVSCALNYTVQIPWITATRTFEFSLYNAINCAVGSRIGAPVKTLNVQAQ